MAKLALLLIKFMKYGIVQFLLYEYLEESQSCVIINLHEQETYKFVQFSDIAKNWNVCTPIIVNISNPNPRSKKFWYTKSFENTLNVCGYKNWIGRWGVCELWKNNIQILPILTKKIVFRWWWRYLWRQNSRTSLKTTSSLKTWNKQGSICWITTLLDIPY